jgi:hypothetical protein
MAARLKGSTSFSYLNANLSYDQVSASTNQSRGSFVARPITGLEKGADRQTTDNINRGLILCQALFSEQRLQK